MTADSPSLRLPPIAAAEWRDPWWRLTHLYWILDKNGRAVRFEPNAEQESLYRSLWYRNDILKARQLGFSTFMAILALDQCMWVPNFTAAVIDITMPDAIKKLRKVEFAWKRLPQVVRDACPVKTKAATEWIWENGSSLYCGVSARGGTTNLLHVSELGKISARFPQKAREIITGAFEAVSHDGIVVVESTAEGASGAFFDITNEAHKAHLEKAKLSKLDFRLHFFPWYTNRGYSLDPEGMHIPEPLKRYFREIQAKLGITLTPGQMAWYAAKKRTLKGDMKREYPSCIAATEPIFTPGGIVPIGVAAVDGKVITRHFDQGTKPVFTLVTDLGYRVTCTADHRIKTPSGFVELQHLKAGDAVLIGTAGHAGGQQETVDFAYSPLAKLTIQVTPEFAEFVGLFMGDGSYSAGTLSIVCDAQDTDVIERATKHIASIVGRPPAQRSVGSKAGGVEIRAGSTDLQRLLDGLGMLRERNAAGQGLMRRVCVPAFIAQASDECVAAFLRGLFEADGFAQRNGSGIKLFSKYPQFCRDVQLLLLRLGITSRVSRHDKLAAGGQVYEGWELSLRTIETHEFAARIGFISARKQARAMKSSEAAAGHVQRRLPMPTSATITSIEPAGEAKVADITTCTHEFSAGGIIVHNCVEEAFEAHIEGAIYAEQMTWLREHGRITKVPLDPSLRVNTFWDLGANDMTAIWFHQYDRLQHRFIRYREANNQGLRKWWTDLEDWRKEERFQWGRHFLPHDANASMLGEAIDTKASILRGLGMRNEVIVPRVSTIRAGYEVTRDAMNGNVWMDRDECAQGIKCLDSYQFIWSEARGVFTDEPLHNWASHGSDAFRQWAQAKGQSMANGTDEGLAKFKARDRRKHT